jgi:hypothetical protein
VLPLDHAFERCRGGTHLRVRHDGLRVGDAMLRCGYVDAAVLDLTAPIAVEWRAGDSW